MGCEGGSFKGFTSSNGDLPSRGWGLMQVEQREMIDKVHHSGDGYGRVGA
jgi:hypothetical protein